jgi:hypothetical protein
MMEVAPGWEAGKFLFGRTMSPLVQRPRVKSPQGNSDPDQHWSMLVFESLSAGVMAVLVGLLAVMVIVGLYVIVVWPLTFWDLTNSGLEKYGAWVNTVGIRGRIAGRILGCQRCGLQEYDHAKGCQCDGSWEVV